jgi:tripartite-type tricarboxylate transporter receptor subunit TctC
MPNVTFPHRRQFLHLAAGAAALPAISGLARAQAYPTHPVHLIVPFAAGGATDIVAHIIGQWLADHLGEQFIIEHRPGAGTNLGTEVVVRAAADGYTLLVAPSAVASNATFYEKLNFNFIRDMAPVAGIVRAPLVMLAEPSLPARTVPEFIAYAKANPRKISMASPGIGTTPHLSGELFKIMANVDLVHVPYRGDLPAIADLLGGQVQVAFVGAAPAIEHIRAGTLRGLAVTTATRSEALPDVPSLGDFLPGYDTSTWFGLAAPKNVPVDIIDKLNKLVNEGLADSKLKAQLRDITGVPMPGSPADFGKLIVEETEKWAKVIKLAGVKPE